MGYYVHIHVCFACDENEGVAALAKKHRASLNVHADGVREAGWFLDDLAMRTGRNNGPKGGVSLWGTIGNYTQGKAFVEALRPFWHDLLVVEVDGGPHDFEHVLVFYEPEQSEHCEVFEISQEAGTLEVKHHKDLPFAFMQM